MRARFFCLIGCALHPQPTSATIAPSALTAAVPFAIATATIAPSALTAAALAATAALTAAALAAAALTAA